MDALKYMETTWLTSFMNGMTFEFPQGMVPFESVSDFRCPEAGVRDSVISGIKYSQVVADYSQCPVTHVYNVLDSKLKYLTLTNVSRSLPWTDR